MAVIFELVINFGSDQAAAAAARPVVADHPPIQVGQHQVRLREPLIHTVRGGDRQPRVEMSIIPARVAYGLPGEPTQDRLQLTANELTELGKGLYRLLALLSGYLAARVGWDPEGCIDPAELRADWRDALPASEISGLVLAEELHRDLHGQGFVPFAPGFLWSPYQGERASSLTADNDAN